MFSKITEAMQLNRIKEKNAEFTFGVHAGALLEMVPDNQATIKSQVECEEIIHHLGRSLMGSVRSLNEKYGLLRQAIMYSFIWRIHPVHGVQFFVYRRTKKNNEGQLAQRLSLGAGGHFEFFDVSMYEEDEKNLTAIIDFPTMCEENYYRERDEEVDGDDRTISPYEAPTLHGFVMDSQPTPGYVGNIHFGMLAGVKMVNENIELRMKEAHNEAEGWMTPADLKAIATGELKVTRNDQDVNFEPWSLLMIKAIDELVATLDVAA